MPVDTLKPDIGLLSQEHVLVQAWKKTAAYIRYHNWYSDTLALDYAAINLPQFLAELAESLQSSEPWNNSSLRIVPAPKSQQWRLNREANLWEPAEKGRKEAKLRPLAHVSLKDQVAATALMLCLADRVETLQGDPRNSITSQEKRERVISYGNRLFCDPVDSRLRHRWGSEKLYRAYYEDYQSFLERPERVAEGITPTNDKRVVIVHSDLRQFYDRVSPALLATKVDALRGLDDDPRFYDLAKRVLTWKWDKRDSGEVARYTKRSSLLNFSTVALPQGLVAGGFFANIALLDFDQSLRQSISQEIEPGIRIEDVCRYVDDLRIVLTADISKSLPDIEQLTHQWLQGLLDSQAQGLVASKEKTKAAAFRGDERPLVRQSRKMIRIQGAISGGFDAIGGEEILDAVQGLMRSQQRYSEQRTNDQSWSFSPIPDVRDATVARFAAGRFRSTYRSLRPLLWETENIPSEDKESLDEDPARRSRAVRTQAELDDDARAFALGLIENWVEDPSNVRLLRIGLDLWPAKDILRRVIDLLRPFTEKGGRRNTPRRVAWYCLSEIFRAGATETGFVEDHESLPDGIDIESYRALLQLEAVRLLSLPYKVIPWYLRQQALLFLAATDPTQAPIFRTGRSPETKHYRQVIRFLRGEREGLTGEDFATLAVLSRRSFLDKHETTKLIHKEITTRRLEQIADRDPSFASEILELRADLIEMVSPRLRDDLCLVRSENTSEGQSLAELVLHHPGQNGRLRNELTMLSFASKFLETWHRDREIEVITPSNVLAKLPSLDSKNLEVEEVFVIPSRVAPLGSMYHPPEWCPSDDRWRFQLGYLLRFILTARQDFTKVVRSPSWKESTPTYRVPESHWYQRLYGLFNGHSAFGDDWLPVSDWVEKLLLTLLRWPGSLTPGMVGEGNLFDVVKLNIEERIRELLAKQGPSSKVLMLPLNVPWPTKPVTGRPLRACIAQTVIPTPGDFTSDDLALSNPIFRKRHRNHLSAALAAIQRMLDLRETHKGRDGRLDLLILPELSVHPRDVKTHLVPFARAHKTIILAGLTYEELFAGQPLVNSALWVLPEWSSAHGLQVLIRRQGKQHLAPNEESVNASKRAIQGFRPCQWLVGYDWSNRHEDQRLWLTASICYDATDLCLASDLRHHSDVFAIPALNKDVSTFDQMALALHYHMFQLVIIANNGLYGGSNAYAPYRDAHDRRVFHLHGQPQASIAFLEIDNVKEFLARKTTARHPTSQNSSATTQNQWKLPPAGM